MAVVANFTANKLFNLIPPSDTIVFTDTSTGSPDKWLWDFGDGNYSSVKNPTHTFTGSFNTQYTVTLTAWIHGSDGPVSEGTGNRQTRGTGSEVDNATAFSVWQGLSYGGNSNDETTFINYNYGGTPNRYGYVGGRVLHTNTNFAALSGSEVIILVEAMRQAVSDLNPAFIISKQNGSMKITVHNKSGEISGIGTTGAWEPVLDITSLGGVPNFSWNHQPVEALLQEVGVGLYGGCAFAVRFRKYTATSTDDTDDISKTVSFIPDATVDFVGTPLIGASPLAVQFTDLSTVSHALSVWNFGDGNTVTFAGQTNPLNTYTLDSCSIALL